MVDGGAGSSSERPLSLELVRVAVMPAGAFGILLFDGLPCGPLTLERTYPVNPAQPRGSQYVKVPPGRYQCVRTVYQRGGYETFEVAGVVGHTRLLFHAGNAEADSEGCILVGLRFSPYSPGILDSRRGHDLLMSIMHGQRSFDLAVWGLARIGAVREPLSGDSH